jgi:DNA uptake protein ComE-like DNA-binding protein
MSHLPLLAEHPRPVQFVLVFVLPVGFGALVGYVLGVSGGVYLVLSALGILGGVGAGYDHLGARPGAGRGAIAGSLFGASILLAHEIHGAKAKASLPDPAVLLVAVTTVLGIAFGALGGWLRARSLTAHGHLAATPGAEAQPADVAPSPPLPPVPPPQEPPAAASASARPAAGSVSLTSGTFEEYRSLGMSVTQAKRVIAYRERDGGYTTVDDLDRVPGFSQQFLEELKRRLEA